MLRTADLDYHLPEDRVATVPASPRDAARLMVLRRGDPGRIEHRHVRDLWEYLDHRALMVLNRTMVLPARFTCVRRDTGGRGEGLYLEDAVPSTPAPSQGLTWRVLLKMRRIRPGVRLALELPDGGPSGLHLLVMDRIGARAGEEAGGWLASVEGAEPGARSADVLRRIGLAPLPPYIVAARKRRELAAERSSDLEAYQTVYAKPESAGSVAAPTAGLHFTPDLLARLGASGVRTAEVVLHVGMGTFKPVESEYVEQHAMHAEWCSVPASTAEALRRHAGSRGAESFALAVGTTTARTLESYSSIDDMLAEPARRTRILITPGHRFRHVGAMMTNFHLPRSTLMAMVAAFLDDDDRVRGTGVRRLLEAYRVAVENGYRFYSFGDAMLILP